MTVTPDAPPANLDRLRKNKNGGGNIQIGFFVQCAPDRAGKARVSVERGVSNDQPRCGNQQEAAWFKELAHFSRKRKD
ncbi:hypothetical protein scyTo_0013560 [Scyliorhinus torazame]|uniref:Uncharacterized protein n=1 Tax=Scyliorhinus torazame TaxID=75743 RepID=A0A401NZI8_SCYTO|nr:hypothetical protein [Scyliorhinus torazame]